MNKQPIYIGVSGLARSGKDLFGSIAGELFKKSGKKALRFALADELKTDVEEFLNIKCDVSPYTQDSEEKNRIRPFLVWYGCYKRYQKHDYWISELNKTIDGTLKNQLVDVIIVTDIRFENEVHWIKQKNGFLVHIKKYVKTSFDGGKTWKRIYQSPPNEEEKINDPLINKLCDYEIKWEDISNGGNISVKFDDLKNNLYLKDEVIKCLSKLSIL